MNDPRLERLRDAALKLDEITDRPDASIMAFVESEQRDALVEYWDAVDQLKPPGPDGRPPTQYLRPRPVGMHARVKKPTAEKPPAGTQPRQTGR